MIAAKKIITVTFVALAFAGSACADMMCAPPLAAGPVTSSHLLAPSSSLPTNALALGSDVPGAADLDSLLVVPLPEANTEAGSAQGTKPPQVLADRQSSLSLCLYVLMGVGLCKTVPSVRKLSLGCIPDWYHSGGPFQVGHSHAVAPDLSFAPAICFIQPDSTAGDLTPNYDRMTIASLMRESLFTPSLLASRGPPSS